VCDEGVAPLRGTSTSPVFADRVVFARLFLLSEKRNLPTWFRAPFPPSSLWKQPHVSAATALITILFAPLRPAWASRSSILTWSRLRVPVMLQATSLKATWIPLQITDALSSGSSLGRATAASAWENLPNTRPYDNCRRYYPLGRWFASLEMTDARCLTAASKALIFTQHHYRLFQ
jgi:hypothetical protein